MFRKLLNLFHNDYIYSVFSRLLGVAAGLVYTIVYRRYFGAALTGEAAVIVNRATMINMILCLGIYQAYPYFRKNSGRDSRELYQEYIDKSVGLFLVYAGIAVLLWFLAPVNRDNKIVIILVPMMFAVRMLNYVVMIETPRVRNTASILLNLLDIVLVLVLYFIARADFRIICVFLIGKELLYFVFAVANLRYPIFRIRPTLKGLWPYIRFGIVPMITIILMEINYKVDVLMLDGKVSAEEIGIYSLGVQMAERMWLIPDALKDILLSKLSKGKGSEEAARIIRISLAVMLVCMALAVLLGRPVISLLFGSEYEGAYGIMLVILASVLSMVFYKMIYAYNVAIGKPRVNMIILAVAAALNVGMNWLLIPSMGIYGAAVASLASYTVCGVAFLVYFHMESGISFGEILLMRKQDLSVLRQIGAKGRKADQAEG